MGENNQELTDSHLVFRDDLSEEVAYVQGLKGDYVIPRKRVRERYSSQRAQHVQRP